MGRVIETGQREQLIALKQKGHSLAAIAQQLDLSLASVRQLSARYKRQQHLMVSYANCGPKQATSERLLQRASRWLKRHHPQGGAPLIRLKLLERYGQKRTPSVPTLQRWLCNNTSLSHPSNCNSPTYWASQSSS